MARVINTEKKKKKKSKIKRIIIIVLIVGLLGAGAFFGYKKFFTKEKKQKVDVVILDSIDQYGYNLSDKDSDYFADEYKKLKDIISAKEINDEEYAKQVAKMFIIDLYSLGTKVSSYDIGGKEFYYGEKVLMYEQKVMDTMYADIEVDYGDRKQELPIVKSVEIESAEKTTYMLGKEKVDGYLVKLKWTYEKSMGYDYQGSIVLVKEKDLKWSVVDYQPTLNPKYT